MRRLSAYHDDTDPIYPNEVTMLQAMARFLVSSWVLGAMIRLLDRWLSPRQDRDQP